ncbi:TPA: glycosyltransferase family 8 protein [Campylobacter jejuni]
MGEDIFFDIKEKIIPAFSYNNIPIVFACNENYIKYLSVSIYSIKNNASKDCNYDIIVLHDNISQQSKSKLKNFTIEYNFSIRFYNMNEYFKLFNNFENIFFPDERFTITTYYRLLIFDLLQNYQKVIYLDVDTLVLNDLKNLYQIDLQDNIVGAVRDYGMYMSYHSNDYWREYLKKIKIDDVCSYFNAGVLLLDIGKAVKVNLHQKLLNHSSLMPQNKILHDQDILNSYFNGNIKFIDPKWNIQRHVYDKDWSNIINSNDFGDIDCGCLLNNSYILHFTNDKPWDKLCLNNTEIWWEYARKTPYYEEILFTCFQKNKIIKSYGAQIIVKNHLSFQLGNAFLNVTNLARVILLPLNIIYLYILYKIKKILYYVLIKIIPSVELKPLEEYSDYKEALSIKEQLAYKLGNAFIKNPIRFILSFKLIYKQLNNR